MPPRTEPTTVDLDSGEVALIVGEDNGTMSVRVVAAADVETDAADQAAAPEIVLALAMRLLTQEGPPAWHPAPLEVQAKCAEAAAYCASQGADFAKLALQFSVAHPDIHTTIVGTANPERILENIRQIEEPMDASLLARVQEILKPIHNVTWPSGRSENN